MGLDRRFEPIDGKLRLKPANLLRNGALVHDRRHLLVVGQPAPELVIERFFRALADAGNRRADFVEGSGKLPLVVGKTRFDENDMHGADPLQNRRGANLSIIGNNWQELERISDLWRQAARGLVPRDREAAPMPPASAGGSRRRRRRLQSVVGPLPTQMLLGETVKLALYRGDELLESLCAARVPRAKDCRDVV